ncbi:MAG TPA: adventurous gliding motility protein CglE [Myxococcaceae bacterium]|nr:adventurous gliding motility protein CglE [Myxococcaceae bacterium]
MNRTLSFCALVMLLSPAVSLAQSAAPVARERREVTFNEIERGFYFAASGGPFFFLKPPADRGPRPFSSGQMARLEMGFDIGERLSVGVFGMFTANRAGSDYLGEGTGSASGDFSMLVPGATARFSFVGLNDAQQVKRTWFYVRAGAGYALFRPKALLPDPDILVFAGPGVEYYTRLRHFSVGVEVTGSLLVSSSSFAVAVTPNLKYAF